MKKLLICVFILALSSGHVFAISNTDTVDKKEAVVSAEHGQPEKSGFSHLANGMNSGFLSLLYTPLKINIALIGGIAGGLAYPFSGFNVDVSKKIWDKSMGGTYLITEDILKGKDELELFFRKGKD